MRGDLRDPLGEEAHEVAPELIQRYPDRALLLATDRCAVYCRFCTRSRMVGAGGGPRSFERLAPALSISARPPGGPRRDRQRRRSAGHEHRAAVRVIAALREIPSVETIRLATRVPVALPQRITQELLRRARAAPSAVGDDPLQPPERAHARGSRGAVPPGRRWLPGDEPERAAQGRERRRGGARRSCSAAWCAQRARPYYLLHGRSGARHRSPQDTAAIRVSGSCAS